MIYFISGHRDLTWEEFAKWYTPAISMIYIEDPLAKFVVGDCTGADSMAQDYLQELGVSPSNVIVYHMYSEPRYLANKLYHYSSDYTSDIERDTAMTDASDLDIAFIRKGREASGTAQNILRRYTKNGAS